MPNKVLTKVLVTAYQRLGRDDVADYFADILAGTDVRDLRQARKTDNDFNLIARLSEIQQPALVLAGNEFGKMAVKIAAGIPGAAFQVLAGGCDP